MSAGNLEGQNQPQFKRELKLLDSTMIVIGSMIGSGIFIVSADIARTVGSPGYLLLVWLTTGIITVIAALSYGELAGMMPHVGGQYAYLREAYNPLIGFLYGWTLFLVIQTGTIAAVAVAFAKFTAVLIPWFGETNILFAIFGLKVSAAQVLAIASVAFLTYVNMRGLREGKIVQDIFTITKTVALLGLILLGIFIARNAAAISANFSNFWNASWTHAADGKIVSIESLSGWMLIAAMGAAMVGSLFSSDAWNNITFTAGEVVNPKRNIPLSLALGTLTVTVLYILANLSYILILPVLGSPTATSVIGRGIQFAADDRVGTAAAAMIFGAPAAIIMAILIMISTFGCNNGLILAGARVYYAMAKDKVFFKGAGKLNSKSVPGAALVVQGIWASLLCLSGTYSNLLDYVIFAVLIFYILTVSGIFILRKKRPDAERPYKAFGYPVLPGLYILVAAAISIDLLIFKPRYTWPGVIIVLLGIPVYFIWKKVSSEGSSGSGKVTRASA
ncbi:MAG: amino acid permease [Bacteroidetes bacterium]|nr:amino acid permease [Bacteroidota bacterium]MCL5737502.1 amino acid permease [Bacteroidota bacterium]